MFTHPQFDPVAIHLGNFGIHWYGLMYLIGFLTFLWLGKWRAQQQAWRGWNPEMVDDAMFFGALGVILGGRLGYVVFYQAAYFVEHPLEVFYVWQGGMSFHGGFLGVLLAMVFLGKKYQKSWLSIMDFVAPLVPIGLGAGRMGNFINGELWGRATNADWGMIFPAIDLTPRHPSQLYEFALEGLLLFAILWAYSNQKRPVGAVSGLFLIGYGGFRFLAEFTREPDAHLGILSLGMSMGQWLSLPMVIVGIAMFAITNKSKTA